MLGKRHFSDSENEGSGSAEAELELQKLQRQYKVLENERKTLYLEAQENLRKQNLEIELLEKEKSELDIELKSTTSATNQMKQKKNVEEMKTLSQKQDEILHKIEKEKRKHLELDQKIKDERKKLAQNLEIKTAQKENIKLNLSNQKKVKKLEDQLQVANNKFGKILGDNKELREEIHSLTIQRQRFDNFFKKIEKEKQSLQQEIAEIIEKSAHAQSQRDEAQEKLNQLNERTEKETHQYNSDMKELSRTIDDNKKLLNFVNTIEKNREEDDEMRQWREKKEAVASEKKKILQEDTLDSYEEALIRIKHVTQESDVDMIVSKFLEVEDDNFAMFNYVNNQNDSIEQLQEEIINIKEKISTFETNHLRSEENRQKTQIFFEEKQKIASEAADSFDEKFGNLQELFDRIKEKILTLFNKIDCDKMKLNSSLGFAEEINEKNCLKYLGLIEEKAQQIVAERLLQLQSEEKPTEKTLSARQDVAILSVTQSSDPISFSLPHLGEKIGSSNTSKGANMLSSEPLSPHGLTANMEEFPRSLDEIKELTITNILLKETASATSAT